MSKEEEEYYTLCVKMPKDLIQKFSTEIVRKFGRTYGNMPNAVKEAVNCWVETQKRERESKQ